VDEIVCHRNILHRFGERTRHEGIASDHLDAVQPWTPLQAIRIANQAADTIPSVEQARHQSAADVACCTGDEDEFGLRHDDNPLVE
jgi:hypothetical protein